MIEKESWLNELKMWQRAFNNALKVQTMVHGDVQKIRYKRDEILLRLLNPPDARSRWRLLAHRYYNLAQISGKEEAQYYMRKYEDAMRQVK